LFQCSWIKGNASSSAVIPSLTPLVDNDIGNIFDRMGLQFSLSDISLQANTSIDEDIICAEMISESEILNSLTTTKSDHSDDETSCDTDTTLPSGKNFKNAPKFKSSPQNNGVSTEFLK
jgi:hypothetical protein